MLKKLVKENKDRAVEKMELIEALEEFNEDELNELATEPTLLNHLLNWGYDPEDYLELLDNIETAEEEKKYLEEYPEEADEEEASYLDDDIADWQEELKSMREDWKPEKKPNMEEEIERIKKWVKVTVEVTGERKMMVSETAKGNIKINRKTTVQRAAEV